MRPPQLEHQHTPAAIRHRFSRPPRPSYLRDWVYGGIDGSVTTFSIVAGVVGADLSARIILILGLANLLADGFSMAAGNYSATKAEIDDYKRLQEIERRHISEVPDGEREEVRQLMHNKGFRGSALDEIVANITADRDRWVETMMQEEYGLSAVVRKPLNAALSTFGAFLLCGAVPLVLFALGLPHAFTISIVATGCVFTVIGALKSQWSLAPAWQSALETLAIGAIAASVAYFVGAFLKTLM